MMTLLLQACSGEKALLPELPKDGTGTLRVMYYDEDQFYRQYGAYFAIEYPDIALEVIGTNDLYSNEEFQKDPQKGMLEFVKKEKPDILLMDQDSLKSFAEEGILYNLDPIIQQEQYPVADFLPGLIESLREMGNGNLYGLTPTYNAQAIYYNADLFKQHNIEPPHHKMTWDEVLNLAARFNQIGSGEDQVYGLYSQYSDSMQYLMNIASTMQLRPVDASGSKVVMDSDGWKQAFKMVADGVKDKSIFVPTRTENGMVQGQDDLFIKGKAAMVMESSWFANQIGDRFKWDKELKPFDWQMVTMPINPATPDQSAAVGFYNIMGIHQDAANKREAWELIKFINSDKVAKINSKMSYGELPTRISYVKEIAGKNAEAFTMLAPSSSGNSIWSSLYSNKNVPENFYMILNQSINEAMDAIVKDTKSVDEALAELQQKLQAAIDEGKRQQEEEKANGEEKSEETSEGTDEGTAVDTSDTETSTTTE